MYRKLKKLFFGKKCKSKKPVDDKTNKTVDAEHQIDIYPSSSQSPKSVVKLSPDETIVMKTKAEINTVNEHMSMPRCSYADIIRQSIENASRAKNSNAVSQTTADTDSDSDDSGSETTTVPAPTHSIGNGSGLILMENTDETDIDTDLYQSILEEVAEFYQHFPELQTDVRILVSKNVVVYVLGTNHANSQCKDDVINIIGRVKPKTVLVELCSLRACSCKKHKGNAFQSTPKFTFRYLRTIITQLGFLPAMIFFTDVFREHLVSESSLMCTGGTSLLHYGGEFIAAMATAQSLNNCKIILADRPIEITVKRQASAMGNWRGLRVTSQVSLALMLRKHMKPLMLSANRLVFDDPKTYEVLVFERDLFLTYSIQQAAKEYENNEDVTRIIAVIGQGHINGIQTYWGKVPSDFIPFIMSPHTVLDL